MLYLVDFTAGRSKKIKVKINDWNKMSCVIKFTIIKISTYLPYCKFLTNIEQGLAGIILLKYTYYTKMKYIEIKIHKPCYNSKERLISLKLMYKWAEIKKYHLCSMWEPIANLTNAFWILKRLKFFSKNVG